MLLADLPPEVMRDVTRLLGGSAISLWLCGSSRLNQLLGSRGGITSIDLSDPSPMSTSRWPKFLTQLEDLTELRINRGKAPLRRPRFVWKELQKLSKLRLLHLTCSDAGKIVKVKLAKGQLFAFGFFFPLLEDLQISVVDEPLRDLDLPPSLTRLSLGSPNSTKHAVASFGSVSDTLRHLTLYSNLAAVSQSKSSHLSYPPDLESLKIRISRPEEIQGLPNCLTSLRVRSSDGFIQSSLDSLPATLTDLRITGGHCEALNVSHLGRLEQFSLKVGMPFISRPSLTEGLVFPISLKHLTLRLGHTRMEYLILPPLLETFRLLSGNVSSIRTDITHNDVLFPHDSTNTPITRPSSPSSPQTAQQTALDAHSRPGVPTTLKHVQLLLNTSSAFPDTAFMESMPQSIQTFHSTAVIPNDAVVGLTSLVSLRLTSPAPPSIPIGAKLTELILDVYSSAIGDSFFGAMPSTLRILNVTYRLGLTEQVLLLMPPDITSLELKGREEYRELSYNGMQHLSRLRSLVTLRLSFQLRSVSGWMTNLLPHSLRHLRLCGASLTGECFTHLPRFLKSLDLPDVWKVTDEDIKHLPRGLHVLTLAESVRLSKECLDWLPSTIRVASIGDLSGAQMRQQHQLDNSWPDKRTASNSIHFPCFNDGKVHVQPTQRTYPLWFDAYDWVRALLSKQAVLVVLLAVTIWRFFPVQFNLYNTFPAAVVLLAVAGFIYKMLCPCFKRS